MHDKISLKDRILKVAAALFYAQGIQTTGINQIISESKVAKATFYHYFPSKDDLVRECIITYHSYLTRTLIGIFDESITVKDYIKKWVIVVKNDFKLKYRGCPIAEAAFHIDSSSREMKIHIHQLIDELILLISDFLDKMKKEGQLPEDINTRLAAEKLITLYEGAATMWRLTNNMKYVDDMEEMIMDVLKI